MCISTLSDWLTTWECIFELWGAETPLGVTGAIVENLEEVRVVVVDERVINANGGRRLVKKPWKKRDPPRMANDSEVGDTRNRK